MNDLKNIIQGEVDSSAATRRAYSRDASIFEVTPSAVIHPKNDRDIRKLINYVTQRRREGADVSLTARNGGTCMSGGSLTESYILDMSRHFNNIGYLDKTARTIWVQGGVMHIDIEKATHPHKLLFAPYTSSRDICGIGGMIGNNASGEQSVRYGATSKNVGKLKVALSDGQIYEFGPLTVKQLEAKKQLPTFEGRLYREMDALLEKNKHLIDYEHPRTVKNAAGYPLWEIWGARQQYFNLARLFVGAQGTLGIVTEAELKLVPMSEYKRMIVVPIDQLSDLAETVQVAMDHHPITCETFDHHTYELAEKYHPDDAKRAHIAKGKHMVVMVIFDGDSQQHVDSVTKKAQAALEKIGRKVLWVDDQEVAESFLLIRRKSFRMLLENPDKNHRAMAFLEDTIVPLHMLDEYLGALEAILNDYKLIYTYAGHIGDGSVRLVPLINMSKANATDTVLELATRVNNLAIAMGGSISADHNDGIIRTPFLPQFFGNDMYTLFAQVKELFDPMGIFNPGKKVGGSLEYTTDHIIRNND